MSTSRRYLAFTGIRSDYDLLSAVYRGLNAADDTEIGLVISMAHMSSTYGRTVRLVEADGVPIVAKIEALLDTDSLSGRIKSAAILLQSCLHSVVAFEPDAIIVAGDREDALIGAIIGVYLGLPVLHFFGGDHAADGNVDNPVRHALSKLASVHFVTHEEHRKRLRCMGEPDFRIHIVGNPALDRFREEEWWSRTRLLSEMGEPDWERYALVVFHSIQGREDGSVDDIKSILQALQRRDLPAFVSAPNSDAGGRAVLNAIERHRDDSQVHVYTNLPRTAFVNLMRHAAVMVGNSSAGLLEAPIIPLGVVNVGERQRGRRAAENVVFVGTSGDVVEAGIKTVLSEEFQQALAEVTSPYGDGHSVPRILRVLRTLDLGAIPKKTEDPLLI